MSFVGFWLSLWPRQNTNNEWKYTPKRLKRDLLSNRFISFAFLPKSWKKVLESTRTHAFLKLYTNVQDRLNWIHTIKIPSVSVNLLLVKVLVVAYCM